jgi:hypothetical protein
MARTATMSFHAIALLGVTHFRSVAQELPQASNLESQSNAIDLDIIGVWVILSAVGAAVPLFLGAAPALKRSKARPLVRLWGVLVIIGAVCAFAGVKKSDEAASRWGFEVTGDFEAIESRCRSASHTPLRSGEALAIDLSRVFGRIEKTTLVGKFEITALVVMGFGIYACLKKTAIGSLHHDSEAAKNNSLGGNWGVKSDYQQKTSTFGSLLRSLELLGLLMASIVVAAIVVLHEMYMLKDGGIPMVEDLAAYEQWSCWAASGLVVLATLINWWIGKMKPTVSTVVIGGGGVYETEIDGFVEPPPGHIC